MRITISNEKIWTCPECKEQFDIQGQKHNCSNIRMRKFIKMTIFRSTIRNTAILGLIAVVAVMGILLYKSRDVIDAQNKTLNVYSQLVDNLDRVNRTILNSQEEIATRIKYK